ncbi:hypothetical protein PV10_01840 [Exophiala mesophila]|uniref:GPI mannosyltransferase 2 n=1 Tax=Exophiala mesophila TaxID=212818 RepID=A0A0D1X862_EXOME|nr:uncharacterized protein PV10_01840 [Exophiala mesophila]KIV98160.1 hypothetical protein PV10_01840 [Exophiala mesophila]
MIHARLQQKRPFVTLFLVFVLWKAILILITLGSPGVGYDTSTSLLPLQGHSWTLQTLPPAFQSQWLRWVRWDAIYFTHIAEHGHVYEQEWAFGVGFSTATSWIANILSAWAVVDESASTIIAAMLLSHTAHLLSVVQLFFLGHLLSDGASHTQSPIPFRAALLHILSPAGIFLSSPNAESTFAFLSMSGCVAYVYAVHRFHRSQPLAGSLAMIAAGLALGAATIFRSNGLLAGLTFLVEAFSVLFSIATQGLSALRLLRLVSTIVGGSLIAVGLAIPQVMAFQDYCAHRPNDLRREWCNRTIPSIFTWVQDHYWNVGLFRYWTLSNLPLFLLAAPALFILSYSALDLMYAPRLLSTVKPRSSEKVSLRDKTTVVALALPQLLIAILALTSYHVQIITRLSSGYPLWYIWLASQMESRAQMTQITIRWMVVYALLQAGLYAGFLPPA